MPQTTAPPIAEKLAEKQKSISIAEFFEKNRQMLGFDSLLMVGYRNPSSPTLGLKSGAGGVWREYQLEAT
jgi:hypothetical protein